MKLGSSLTFQHPTLKLLVDYIRTLVISGKGDHPKASGFANRNTTRASHPSATTETRVVKGGVKVYRRGGVKVSPPGV